MDSTTIIFILKGLFCNFLVSYIIHWLLIKKIANEKISRIVNVRKYIESKYRSLKRRYKEMSLFEIVFMLLNVFFCAIFTDILIADYFKMKLGTDKEKRKKYITIINHLNLTISLSFMLLAFMDIKLRCPGIIVPFILLRALSRSYEILIAFSNDIINEKKKSSTLSSSDRLKLAINSFVEIIVNYSIAYYLMSYTPGISIDTLIFFSISSSLSKGIGISTLTNVGDLTLVSTMQLLSSMSLIYFGLAGYIGSNDKAE